MSALLYRARLRPVVEAIALADDRPRPRFVADPPGRTASPPPAPGGADPATGRRRSRPSDVALPGWLGRLPAIDAAATAWTGPGGADPGDRRDPARQAGRPAPRGCRWFVLALFLAVLWRPLAGVANGIIHRGSRSPEGIVMKTFNDHGRAILICAGATIVATARADGRVGLEMDYDGDGVTDEARTVRWSRLTR